MASAVPEQQSTPEYDGISLGYAKLYPNDGSPSSRPQGLLEEVQLKDCPPPPSVDIRGKKVLDLAGGSGFCSFRFLDWGAASVTSVDISPGQVGPGRLEAIRRDLPASKIQYFVADAAAETRDLDGVLNSHLT